MKILSLMGMLIINTFIMLAQCDYSKNEVDEFTGAKNIVVEGKDFINHTPEDMKKYMGKRSYVTCNVSCVQVGEQKAAYFRWKIQSKSAYKHFGSINSDAKMILKFTDGTMLELRYSKYDNGDTNYDYDYTTYRSYAIIDEGVVEELKSKEIDKVRMYWSKGYADYDAIIPSVFIEQLPCLDM